MVFILVFFAALFWDNADRDGRGGRRRDEDIEVGDVDQMDLFVQAVDDGRPRDEPVVDLLDLIKPKVWEDNKVDVVFAASLLGELSEVEDVVIDFHHSVVFNLAVAQLLVPPAPLDNSKSAVIGDCAEPVVCRAIFFLQVCGGHNLASSLGLRNGCIVKTNASEDLLSLLIVDHVSSSVIFAFQAADPDPSSFICKLIKSSSCELEDELFVCEYLLTLVQNAVDDFFPLACELALKYKYKICTIGHCVGGSAALIASMLLKKLLRRIPSLTCDTFAFGPMPVMRAQKPWSDTCYIFVNHRDYLPRMSRVNLEKTFQLLWAIDELRDFSTTDKVLALVRGFIETKWVARIDVLLAEESPILSLLLSSSSRLQNFSFDNLNVTFLQAKEAKKITIRGDFLSTDFCFVGGGSPFGSHEIEKSLHVMSA